MLVLMFCLCAWQALAAGAAVVVHRGNCTWVEKAAAVQAAGGALVVVVNNDAGATSSHAPHLTLAARYAA